ncbi:MAG: CooT family nickel-binding protein [Deltaproteobacteria bacterium]|nr:CooT family nickel-binding protein [Deltaproteobacteria bacterium]
MSTVYMDAGDEQKEIMKDVARIEAEGRGLWLINLFEEKVFVEGRIQTVNLVNGSYILIKKEEDETYLSV